MSCEAWLVRWAGPLRACCFGSSAGRTLVSVLAQVGRLDQPTRREHPTTEQLTTSRNGGTTMPLRLLLGCVEVTLAGPRYDPMRRPRRGQNGQGISGAVGQLGRCRSAI